VPAAFVACTGGKVTVMWMPGLLITVALVSVLIIRNHPMDAAAPVSGPLT